MLGELFHKLSGRCEKLAPRHSFRFKNPLFTIDGTTMSVSLKAYGVARYRTNKEAVKLHTQQNLSSYLPCQVDKAEPLDQDLPGSKRERCDGQVWATLVHFLLVTYNKVPVHGKNSFAEITARLKEHLIGRSHLMELLSLDRKTLAKPSD